MYSASTSTQKLPSYEVGSQHVAKAAEVERKGSSAEANFNIVLFNNLTGDRLTLATEMAAPSSPT